MPLFRGVGPRIAERLRALGYVQTNGKPDVSRWCRSQGWDKTVIYYYINDQRTPVKDLTRLASDLGVTPQWLLLGAEPTAKKRGRPRKIIASILLALTTTVGGVPASPGTAAQVLENMRLIGSRRRPRAA